VGQSPDRQDLWIRNHRQTPEGKKYWLQARRFTFKVEADGTFRLADVPSGDYELDAQIYFPPGSGQSEHERPLGIVKRKFTVPNFSAGRQSEPYEIGNLEIDLVNPPDERKSIQ
jgi:hypothetical protein